MISGKMMSLTQTVRPVLNEAWAKRPLGTPRHPKSESRTSTRTRAASLEKMQRAGSIKINHSIISKSGYRVEEVGQRVDHAVSRSSNRAVVETDGSLVFGLTMKTAMTMKRVKKGEINFIWEKKFIVAKVKNSVMLQPRMGEWIPIDCNLNVENNNDFYIP